MNGRKNCRPASENLCRTGKLGDYLTMMVIALAIVIMTTEASAQIPPKYEEEIIVEYSIEENEVEEFEEDIQEDNEVDFASDFDYYSWLIGYTAERNGIDKVLAVSISRLETGNWESISNHFNFGGLSDAQGKPYRYKSEVEGLEAYMQTLIYYRDNGMDTVDKMAKRYCTSPEWANKVKRIMKEVENYETTEIYTE